MHPRLCAVQLDLLQPQVLRHVHEHDPNQHCPDIRRARELIEFDSNVPLREGLAATVKDFAGRPRG
jgi:hypothetical protein